MMAWFGVLCAHYTVRKQTARSGLCLKEKYVTGVNSFSSRMRAALSQNVFAVFELFSET